MHYSVEEESQSVQNEYRHLDPAQELIPVHLRNLIVGKLNECAVLYGELCVSPFKFGKIHTVMKEADTEDAVVLCIVSSDPLSINKTFARKTYPKGTKIVVKEPRLVKSKNGFIFIDVDNPLSIERVESFPSTSDVTDTINEKFEQWFGDGDRAHEEKEWNECVRNYTRSQLCGLSRYTGHEQKLKHAFKLLSDRCRAYIELQRYAEALQDAEKCWQLEPSNTISNVLKVESLVALGKYKAAYNFIQTCSKPLKQHNAAIFRQTCMKYYDIGESIAGITGKLEIPSSEPDADFIGAVEIKMTKNGCGRGLFATEYIKAGEVLLVSKALAVCDKYSSSFMFDPLKNGLIQNVRNALSAKGDRTLQHFFSHDEENFNPIIPKMSEFIEESSAGGNSYTLETTSQNLKLKILKVNVREIFKNISGIQVQKIIQRIAFDDRSLAVIEESVRFSNAVSSCDQMRRFFGVWILPSFINHSCAPNAARINVGRDIMRVHATKDINRGEEITIPYFDVVVPGTFRQSEASEKWGFFCLCHRCAFERYIITNNAEGRLCFERFTLAYNQAISSRIHVKRPLLPCYTSFDSSAGKTIDLESMSVLSTDVEFFSKDIDVDDQERRSWIISAFALCYLAFLVEMMRESGREDPGEYEDDTYRGIVKDLIEAIAGTCPGDPRYLLLCQKFAQAWKNLAAAEAVAKNTEDSENYSVCSYAIDRAEEETKKAFICVYGQQKPHVAAAIDSEIYSVCSYAIDRAEEETKKAFICVYGQQKPHVAAAIMSKYSNKGIL